MSGFSYHRRTRRVIATFHGVEGDLLRSLARQLVELLRDEVASPETPSDPLAAMLDFAGPVSEPDDPVLARLLPNAYRDDDESSAEFRRFTEGTLRDGKAAAAATVVETLEDAGLSSDIAEIVDDGGVIDVELDEPTAQAWLRAFTDIRLALATRIGVEEGDEEHWRSLPDDDPQVQIYGIYQWVGALQETLVEALWEQ